nr:hypothetical protein [Tanacetum cinerariifolium]
MKGLSECKASESNITHIRVKDIVKEVEYYLKTYSSTGMDSNEEQAELKVFSDTKIAALRLKFNAFKSHEGEKVNETLTRLKCLLNDLENKGVTISQAEANDTLVNSLSRKWLSMNQTQTANNSIRNDSLATLYGKYNYEEDVEEDQRTNNEFMADLNVEYHERALLANQKRFYKRIDDMTKGKKDKEKSEKGLLPESFDWDDESVSSDDERITKIRAFMAIAEDEPSVGKANARSGQWVDITMKKVHILLSMTDGDERKHVLDYTHVVLHYVEDQRKNLTCSKVTLDQLLSEQVHGNIVKALGEKCRRKEKISSKEVVFTKANESSSMLTPEITSDSDSKCDSQEPLPPLPKLIGAAPSGTPTSLISLSNLTLNMVDLTLDTHEPKKTRPSFKLSPAYVIKKKTEKFPTDSKQGSDKKDDSSTEQLLLTLMEEKKPKCFTCRSTEHLTKEHLEHVVVKKSLSKLKAQSPLKPSPKKAPMIPKPFKECKYCRFNDHHFDHCEFYPRCEVCGSIAHEASDCLKKHSNSRRPRITNRKSEPTEK